jgi:choline-glycine betaine transporter
VIDLLKEARARSEEAVRSAAWGFAGGALLVLALGFAAAALVEALLMFVPSWAAFSAGAVLLLLAGSICFARSRAKNKATALNLGDLHEQPPFSNGSWQALLNEALIRESREKPARAAAIAAIAGLVLGAIEGLDESGPPPA